MTCGGPKFAATQAIFIPSNFVIINGCRNYIRVPVAIHVGDKYGPRPDGGAC